MNRDVIFWSLWSIYWSLMAAHGGTWWIVLAYSAPALLGALAARARWTQPIFRKPMKPNA